MYDTNKNNYFELKIRILPPIKINKLIKKITMLKLYLGFEKVRAMICLKGYWI